MSRRKVQVTPHRGGAAVEPMEYLGPDFGKYLSAVRSVAAKFQPDGERKCHVLPYQKVPALAEALYLAGLEVLVDPAVEAKVKAAAEELVENQEETEARVRSVDEELARKGLSLYPYQKDGVRWLADRTCGALFDEMGLGKTVQSLVAIPREAPVLIVCPASLKGNWRAECQKWRPDLDPVVLAGKGSFRWPGPGEAIIVNYDILPGEPRPHGRGKIVDSTPGCNEGTILIADEAHACKNRKALRTLRMKALVRAIVTAGGRAWPMTGTPLLNTPPELWSILQVFQLEKEAFGTWPKFQYAFGGRRGRFGIVWGEPRDGAADQLRRVSLRRRREEVLPDLPTKTYRTITVEDLDPKALAAADEVLKALEEKGVRLDSASLEALAGGKIDFEVWSKARKALAVAKIPALLDLIAQHEEAEDPVVVFSAHREPVNKLGIRPTWKTILGGTPNEERTEIVGAFQAGELKGLAGTIKAAGVGLTLTRAHEAIFVDLEPTPALNAQAEDRVCRIGQDRGVIITHLVADHPLDRRIHELLEAKTEVIGATVEKSSMKEGEEVDRPSIDAGGLSRFVADVEDEAKRLAKVAREARARKKAARYTGDRDASTEIRHPEDPYEYWCVRALLALDETNPDFAQEENGVGFNKPDSFPGKALADLMRLTGGLTERGWRWCKAALPKYRGQVGEPPRKERA